MMAALASPRHKILVALTGSISCFKACALISKLAQLGFELEVIATAGALEFVGRASLEGLVGKKIHTDTFEPGQYMAHIQLAKWADLILIYPASANSINKFAHGIGDDLLSTTLLARDLKSSDPCVWIAPAMNSKMYQHPATQLSIKTLSGWGFRVMETGSGALACGDVGEGRLIEPETLLAEIQNHFLTTRKPSRLERPLNILLTSGGTRETIDSVRSICNTSTGKTGAALADQLAESGHALTHLRAIDSVASIHPQIKTLTFTDFANLEAKLIRVLTGDQTPGTPATPVFDVVIHLAAVSDYSVAGISLAGRGNKSENAPEISPKNNRGHVAGNQHVNNQPSGSESGREFAPNADLKLDSNADLQLRLKKNRKLIDHLREWSGNPKLQLIAFKLTHTNSEGERLEAVKKLASHANANWIIHNDLNEIHQAQHVFTIYDVDRDPARPIKIAQLNQVDQLAEWLKTELR